MKKILIYFCFLITCGCQPLSQVSQNTTQASTRCPREPKNNTLSRDNVKDVVLKSESLKESGQASADKPVGYAFEAKAGQKLSYRTTDDICISLYAPNTELISSGDLPITGKYTLQVSTPKGSTTFNLEMSLGTLSASTPFVSPSPSKITFIRPSAASENIETSDFTEEQALALVKRWYDAKPQIFAPPFDTSLVDELTTGNLHYNKIKPNGSIDWLRSNNSYYTYNYSRISNNVVSFSNRGKQPAIIVNVEEELYLHGPRGIDSSSSGQYQGKYIYFFQKDNNTWKISDYKKVM